MTTDAAAEPRGVAREGLLARHPLVFFFLIAYAGSWLLSLPCALSEDGAGLLPFSSPPCLCSRFLPLVPLRAHS